MLCEKCNKNIANVYLKNNVNGNITENYLCSSCANEVYGKYDKYDKYDKNTNIFNGLNNDFVADVFNMFDFNKMSHALAGARNVCPLCGSNFSQITQTGKVGCGECYKTFKNELEPNVMRIHGRAIHTGKIPKNMSLKISNKRKAEELNIKLKKCISEQNFEEAAEIRDEIKKLNAQEGVI